MQSNQKCNQNMHVKSRQYLVLNIFHFNILTYTYNKSHIQLDENESSLLFSTSTPQYLNLKHELCMTRIVCATCHVLKIIFINLDDPEYRQMLLILSYLNRKEAMIRNQYDYLTPSIQRHQRERRMHLKQRNNNQNTTSRKPKRQFLSQ